MSAESKDTELENGDFPLEPLIEIFARPADETSTERERQVLQQIFMECDASTLDSMVPVSDAVPISRIVQYVQDQLPALSIDSLVELWRCLVAVSPNHRVNLHQFKEATKLWIAKMQQVQSARDGGNNTREKLYIVNNPDSSMKTMAVDKDIVESELRVKLQKLCEENIVLRDELERHEGSINNLKQQHSITERQLKHYMQRCQYFENENDEQREQLDELIKKERTMALALQKYTKEHQNLLTQLEAAEIEVQVIPSLKEKLEKITKQKMDCMKLITKMQEEFDEKEDNCKQLKSTIIELEDTSITMKESYEYTIRNLREKNRLLADENVELQSLSLNECTGERLSISPIPETDGCCTHSTPYKTEKVPLQDSLFTELQASGFTAECSRNESRRQELEEELDEYNAAISVILKQLEKVIQFFVTIRGSAEDLPHFNPQDTDARVYNVDILKHKAAFLLNMVTEEITRRNTRRGMSTQLRADSANTTDSLDQFGVRSFRDLLPTHARLKTETGLRSIASYGVNNEDDDSFSRVIKTYTGVQNRFRIIEPIIEELHDIIESTLGTLADRKDCPLSGNSRYRSIHTLPSSSQSSSLTAEDSRWQTFGYQNPETNTTDAPSGRGDGLTQEDRDEKSAPLAAKAGDSNQENPVHSEENQSSEMPRISNVLQIDSKALATSEEEKTSTRNFQVPEVSSASNPASPRRKISVYCRSFDVVEVQDRGEDHPGSNLEVRQSPSNPVDSPTIDRTDARDQNSTPGAKYPFNHVYRNAKSDSDSSNSTPGKQFQDSLLDDEPSVEQIPRKVHLAPTRLRFPQEARNELNRTTEASNCASPVLLSSTELDISNSSPSPIVNGGLKKDNDASVHSSSTSIDKCKMEAKSVVSGSTSCSNENVSQANSMPNHRLFPRDQADSAKIADSKDPHSQSSVQRVDGESQSRIERSVDSQMSRREDSLTVSDSERKPAAGSNDRCTGEKVANEVGKAVNVMSSTSLADPVSKKVVPCKNVKQDDEKARERNLLKTKQEIQKSLLNTKRSLSEGENLGRLECKRCKRKLTPLIPEGNQHRVFPSLTDLRLQESGIANLSDELNTRENPSELELQKKYTAFSLCLCTDRVTLPRRVAMSLRQRDQTEKNLFCEVQKMQQDIQELAPLCTDRESVERVERVRHQLDMIVRCAHRVSCTAETLGAVQQERRISRAVLLADKYLQLLQSRCEKLIANVTETKQILIENNIVIEENSGELNDELPRIRYRSGTSANNRMMMTRRRASVATMSRPLGSAQDVTKDTVKQRNSVSGRMTLRRPSFSESPNREIEKMDRTESSNSINELRGIFEQAESRRSSKEENNNMLRLSHSNSQSRVNCAIIDNKIWTNVKEEASPEPSDNESINSHRKSSIESSDSASINSHSKSSTKPSQPLQIRRGRRRIRECSIWDILTIILIFFLVFYVIQAVSIINVCHESLNKRFIKYIFDRYGQIRNAAPHPM